MVKPMKIRIPFLSLCIVNELQVFLLIFRMADDQPKFLFFLPIIFLKKNRYWIAITWRLHFLIFQKRISKTIDCSFEKNKPK